MSKGEERPEALGAVADADVVELDVRDELRQGREPFQRIMAAKEAIPPGGALKLRAIFEPAPLYGVLGSQGFDHWTEHRGDEDWVVWFWRAAPASAGTRTQPEGAEGAEGDGAGGAPGQEAAGGDGVVVLDVRGMDPPEPMVRTLAALEELPRDHTLVQLNVREPRFLFPKLEEQGFEYEVKRQSEDLVRVFIRHAGVERRMERAETEAGMDRVLDVRVIPPREKHPAIFETFAALEPGSSFVLVNDHDPKPLRYQFEFEHAGEYGWRYLEQGPTVWRVEISKVGG